MTRPDSPTVRCATRALKNARYLQEVAPEAIPMPGSEEGFGTGIALHTLARLHHLSHDDDELRGHEALSSFLRDHKMPVAGRDARGPLFNGTIYFVQVAFKTPGQTFTIPDADMNTIIEYATHAVVPISEYASQYGPNSVHVAGAFLRYTATLPGTSYTDADLQGWISDIANQNNLAASSCVAIVSPYGVTAPAVGGNSGYHGRANLVYTVFGVYRLGLTIQDLTDDYAMVVSHEIAELVVDPNIDGSNPEVCDPCDLNCGPLHRCYFDAADHYLGATAALPPAFPFEYYVCAVVTPSSASICPAPAASCDYEPPIPLHIPHPEQWMKILFGIVNDAGGIAIQGGHIIHVPPWGPELEILAGVLIAELAKKLPGEHGHAIRTAAMSGVIEAARRGGA